MSFFRELALAVRLLRRDQRAGELALIATAIVIAVASVTTVGFFTDRVHQALGRQANQLLGADLVIVSDRPVGPELEAEARARGLAVTRVMRFPSMAIRGERNVLASVKAVGSGYPLRGELRLADALYGADRRATTIPERGTAWVDERLFAQLGLTTGDRFELGRLAFRVPAVLTHEPDTSIGFLNSGPRIIINEADIEATDLIQPGSRVGYRLQVAGSPQGVDAYRAWALQKLKPGQRVEGIRDARPEIRSALDRAEKFLSLAALVSVVLAAVAIGLSARRFLQRHLDACAMMRCLGASDGLVLRLYVTHFALLGIVASVIGCAVGIGAQALLARWLGSLVAVKLPAPGALPALHGIATGLALLLGFALPPLTALGRVPTLRVLRRDLGVPGGSALLTYAAGYAVIAAMIFWKAHDLKLGAMVIGGFTAAMVVAAVLTWLLLNAAGALRTQGVTWRYGIANLRRRVLGSVLQVIALGIGMMALLVLTLVRHDLLSAWQTSLPPDAPNRFIVNVQPEQVPLLRQFFEKHAVRQPPLYPMVRARLVQINDRRVSSATYADERARRLVDREFNLSWAERMQSDNRLAAGQWWSGPHPAPQFSVEDGIAETLGMHVNDVLTFDVAGTPVSARVTSLRKVDWDTFNVNFFVVAPPGVLEQYPATFVTSFYLPPGNAALLASLVREFPNFLLIDVAQVMGQVQKMMDQVAQAVEFIFLFTLLAGVMVLYAAIGSTQDERLYEASIMRTLGASRGQLRRAIVAEFAVLGALAGLLAAAGATALGFVIATRILNLPYTFSGEVWLVGTLAGAAGIAAAGYAGTRSVLRVAPLKTLRELS
ncbi:MAG TPA: FtsX-like permease family protein [Burkholderiales bacterium]|nr:FtsX-like permease family protein [Burkholderiales bacterium]